MKPQIKIITEHDLKRLEERTNEWLSEAYASKRVIKDIRIHHDRNHDTYHALDLYTAVIHYEV